MPTAPMPPYDAEGRRRKALRKLHQTVKKITEDFESRWHFNTSIAAAMELLNECWRLEPSLRRWPCGSAGEHDPGAFAVRAVCSQELWEELGGTIRYSGSLALLSIAELAREDEAADSRAGKRETARPHTRAVWVIARRS